MRCKWDCYKTQRGSSCYCNLRNYDKNVIFYKSAFVISVRSLLAVTNYQVGFFSGFV